jgi:steroid delta-isomerase-like uncharacterized protein
MQTKEEEDALRRSLASYVAAWNAGDVDAIAALFAEDGRYGEFGEGSVLSGRDQIADHFRALVSVINDLRLTVSSPPFCAVDRVFFKWTMRGRIGRGVAMRVGAAESFELHGATVLVFDDGKISRAADSFESRAARALASNEIRWLSGGSLLARAPEAEEPPEDNICYGE